MRAQLLLAGLVVIAGACSTPDADVDPVSDERNATPDLALSAPSEAVPVASDVEVGQPAADHRPDPGHPSPEGEIPQPEAEPLGSDLHGQHNAAPAISVEPMPVAANHVHPKAPDDAMSEGAVEGGGKPTGVSTGLGPVPDRNWGDPGIMDDPNPIPDLIGRTGAVIIRGGAGGVDDDCAIHPRGGTMAGPTGPGALVNDRDPRRGALINERAPQTSRRPALPRGGGFPGGGLRGGIR